jgi:hypothetical protein
MATPYTLYGDHLVQASPTGSAGSATATVTTARKVFGFIYQINIKYNSMPATTNVVVSAPLSNGNTQTLANVPTNNTDISVAYQLDVTDVAGVATGDKRWPLVLEQLITVAVTGANAVTNGVEVSIQVI